ncbi:MAG: DUF1028 domain-containing protein [Candidatus Binatia bacterium]
MTYSIVARDPDSGAVGVAVQSCYFSVGAVVPWAEAGVGAVATQSFVDPSYGPLGLELMRCGKSAPDALQALVAHDPGAAYRQVAMIDMMGRVAVHTGERCLEAAGHCVGEHVVAQANLMARETVWGAMIEAFERTEGDLATCFLAALDAAEREGGDRRGKQSAAMLIVRSQPTGKLWLDRVVDLRVEDHAEPIDELKRLLALHREHAVQSTARRTLLDEPTLRKRLFAPFRP